MKYVTTDLLHLEQLQLQLGDGLSVALSLPPALLLGLLPRPPARHLQGAPSERLQGDQVRRGAPYSSGEAEYDLLESSIKSLL